MQNKYSINIDDFTGVYKKMAEQANINGGKTLEDIEISIFNEILSTFDDKKNTFIIENKYYNSEGNEIDKPPLDNAKRISTNIFKQMLPENFTSVIKNLKAVEMAKKAAKEIQKFQNKPVKIIKNINGKKVSFDFKRSALENYIIKYSENLGDCDTTNFSKIPDIRKKSIAFRTKEESKILQEFNNLADSVINAGTEYGVDPKFILAIIQKEVKFDGINKAVTGDKGKGYMQLTGILINDMLGATEKKENGEYKFQKDLKTNVYGNEIIKLFKSRGFKVDCPPDKRGAIVQQIMDYLKQNKDADFNIRIGTILLRKHLKKTNGDIEKAAQLYNTVFSNYGKVVKKIYNKICKSK